MLTTRIIHPELLAALARCGHGTKILLADGNYPHLTGTGPACERIALNIAPGLITVDAILGPLLATVPVEAGEFMLTAAATKAPAVSGYQSVLGQEVPLNGLERFAFYEAARRPEVAVVIATGDQRAYANLLLTVGTVPIAEPTSTDPRFKLLTSADEA